MASPNLAVRKPRPVIIGAGFGGLSAAKRLTKITGLSGSRMEDMPMPAPMDPPQPNQARHAA